MLLHYKKLSAVLVLCLSNVSIYAAPGMVSANASSSAALSSNVNESIANNTENNFSSDTIFTMDFTKIATLPGFTISAPSGLVPSWGVIFGSAGGITNSPGSNKADGAASFGFGFGDSQKSLGGALTLGIGSVNADGGEFERGSVGVTLGHLFTETLTSISVGAQNIAGWNSDGNNADASLYAAITQVLANNFVPIILTGGIGNNGYFFLRSNESRTTNIAPFFSAGFYILPQLSFIADYTQGVTSTGISVAPIASIPVTINLGAWDLFEYAPDHNNVSFMGSISYAYTF